MSDAWVRAIVAVPFGLVVGSFLTVVAGRVPAGESIVTPRSKCPSCGTEIRARDNVPVLSWAWLRGRCRSCGARISVRYPLVELGTALAFAGVAAVHDSVFVIVMLCAFVATMIAVTVIDLEHRIIPNRITYPAFPAFVVSIAIGRLVEAPVDPVRALMGALAYGGAFLVIAFISPSGLGMGDVKLTALIGLVLGSLGLRYVGVAAGAAIVSGGIGGIVALLAGRSRKSAIPFGPYLAAGAILATLWGEEISGWYLRSFA